MIERGLEETGGDEVTLARFAALKCLLQKWYDRKACYWKQLSRDRDVKELDGNTKYFHTVASIKRRRKLMVEIKVGRRSFRNPRCINQIRSFYKKLYHQPAVPKIDFDDSFLNKISEEEARFLERMPTHDEIKSAVWECDPSKAQGYDGFNLKFIKELWVEVGDDFVKCVLDFFCLVKCQES